MLELEYPNFILFALYIPHGGRKQENMPYKLEVYHKLISHLSRTKNKHVILAGDFNIAHNEIDLARPKDNRKNTCFTPRERAELDKLISHGFIDSFREINKEGDNYTWWPYMNNLRERNIGWRLDYIFVSNKLAPNLKKSFILKDDKGSDHCPIGAELDI
jgi:exodeoxyribonuclease-3